MFELVPPAVAPSFQFMVPNKFLLTTPNGSSWGVHVENAEQEVRFVDGFNKFITDTNVTWGDFNFFTHTSLYCFDVVIFNKSACEVPKYGASPGLKIKVESGEEPAFKLLLVRTHVE